LERRLAAILIADVVGYSRLSRADEEGTRTRFQADFREILEPKIAEHHGRLVKTMGDGLLVEFHSVVDAVRCAVDVQRAKAKRNAGLPPDRRLEFRIGINLGDVIVEGDDIHGDGVNVAARLQGLAEPGGVTLSGTAYDHVKTKLPVGFADLGEQPIKNIPEPVRAYRLLLDPKHAGKTIGAAHRPSRSLRWPMAAAASFLVAAFGIGMMLWPRETPCVTSVAQVPPAGESVAVLPLDNLSGDPQQEPIVEGIADDLTTALSRIRDLFVIARHSSFAYKGRSCDVRRVAKELGVRHLIEGSVQRAHDRLRINVQLISGATGGHEWADSFEGTLAEVFDLQTKVVESIADALALRLTDQERQALVQQETAVPAAYEAFLRGWEHLRRDTPDDYAKAIPYLEEATKRDPNYGRAFAALAMAYISSYDAHWTDSLGISEKESLDKATQNLKDAQMHPTALSHQVAAIILWINLKPEKALTELKEAIALDPGDAFSFAHMGAVLTSTERPAEAVSYIRTAMRLDPHYPPMFDYFLGSAQFAMRNFEDAAASFATATRLNPDYEYAYVALAAVDGHLGRKQDAASAVARYNGLRVMRGGVPLTIGTATMGGFTVRDGIQRLWAGLRLAGVPEFLFDGEFAAQNRMTAGEIRTLIFGHRLHGRSLWHGEERFASVTTDGIVTLSGDWGLLGNGPWIDGRTRFEKAQLCYTFDFMSYCGGVFRNPGATRAKENEFIWYNGEAFTFSVFE